MASPDHQHRDCRSRERVWLPREPNGEASAVLHPFCLDCGTVRDLTAPRAKPLGYFLGGVASLKEHLEHSGAHFKLAQVQSHRMVKLLASRQEFEDQYGTPGRTQLEAYVSIVRFVRPDLDEDLVLRALQRAHRRMVTAQGSAGPGLA